MMLIPKFKSPQVSSNDHRKNMDSMLYDSPEKCNNRKIETIERSPEHLKSLCAWVSLMCREELTSFEEMYDGEKLGMVLRDVHGCGKFSNLQEIVYALESALKLPAKRNLLKPSCNTVNSQYIADIIQMILIYAVQCDEKERFISEIMNLDSTVQQHLMVEIDTGLQMHSSACSIPPSPSPFKKSVDKPKLTDAATNALRLENQQLLQQVEDLKDQLTKFRSAALEDDFIKSAEFQTTENSLKEVIESKNKEITTLRARVQVLEPKLEKLQDEVDILTVQSKENERNTITIRKLQEKLENFTSVSEKLSALEAKNEDLVKRNVAAEESNQIANKLRQDLEKYKDACTDAQFQTSELKLLLEEKTKELNMLKQELEQKEEQVAIEPVVLLRDDGLAEGVSCELGISELNPQVREDLERLRNENRQLKLKLSEFSEDHLNELVFQVESMSALKEKLERELVDAKSKINGLQDVLMTKEATIVRLQEDYRVLGENHNLEVARMKREAVKLTAEFELKLADAAEAMVNVETELAESRDHCKATETQLINLKATLSDYMEKHAIDNEESRRQVEHNRELESKIDMLKREGAQALEAHVSELSQVRSKADAEIRGVREQLTNESSHRTKLQTDLFQFHSELVKSQSEVESLRGRLKSLQAQRGLASSRQPNDNEISEVRQEMLNMIEQLKLQMESGAVARSEPAVVGGQFEDLIKNYESEIENHKREHRTLMTLKAQELAKRSEAEQNCMNLKKQLKAAEEENVKLRLKIERGSCGIENQHPNVILTHSSTATKNPMKPQYQSGANVAMFL